MRRLGLIASIAVLAAGIASLATLSASAETSEPSGDFTSQGSVADPNSRKVKAEWADIAEEERLPDYSQVVDNTNRVRFSAAGWKKQRGDQATGEGQVSYGEDYITSGSGGTPARFEVSIPTSNDYTVYAWWPAFSSNSETARFVIETALGTQWTRVDQTRDGGIWIKLGTYAMEKGERFIQVSPDSSGVTTAVADAVAVVRGDVTVPPDEGGTTSSSSDATYSATSLRNPTRHDVVKVAKRYIGTRYRWGTCTRYRMSCTCETRKTYAHFGHTLRMDEWGQWRY
jgi:cell wall-associated NlpC family hydrolase